MRLEMKKGRIVAMTKNVVQSGKNAGEIRFQLSISDGEDCVQNLPVSDEVAQKWSALKQFVEEYDFVFDYSTRAFNNNAYTFFSVVDVVPSASDKK